ncbi:hypothetical protein JCGZ_19464 [Jatropha curcas]|uniref:Uncharacterized protein n=3 Tax=Jatropha curcas TaxID=180498 RepID=A0A067JVR2_JATCU|nr:hypothetical protein JCGZ_19464 [Jatropha curcas]
MFIVIQTWVELVTASITLHLSMFHKTVIWIIALISLPIRVLTALQRERRLQEHLHEMKIVLDNLVWDRKELQGKLQTAIKECRILESMLAEVEEENDRVIAKLELLEGELQDLKQENLQLKEILGKDNWSFKGQGGADNAQNVGSADTDDSCTSDRSQPFYKGSDITFDDLVMNNAELLHLLKTGCATEGPIHSFSISRRLEMNKGLDQRRDAAFLQSIFSAVLSLLIGLIIWEAQDPCMPLVIALFVVVGMSLKSVVQFFSTIKNKPASDAVALLSFNWFMLGTLTYPALPTVAHMFALLR